MECFPLLLHKQPFHVLLKACWCPVPKVKPGTVKGRLWIDWLVVLIVFA